VNRLRLPDFIVGGAPRSGTTWLYWLLDRHPGVYMAKPVRPEPKFFLVDAAYERGLEYYSSTWFEAARAGVLVGEKSTDYLESAAAATRMARDIPLVKLIFILREPVERAYSNYLWSRMNGLEREDFATALKLEKQRERDLPDRWRHTRPFSYFSRGLYADLLGRYYDRFPREQILVLRFEHIADDPRGLATRVQRFLGLDTRPQDADDIGVINAAERDMGSMPPELARTLAERYAEPNARLAQLLGPDFAIW
jgi:sulfotransferase family protein